MLQSVHKNCFAVFVKHRFTIPEMKKPGKRTAPYRALGERLRAARDAADYTQKEIADIFEISEQAVSQWENGRSRPDIEKLTRLAQLYKVQEGELLGADVIAAGIISRGRRVEVINRIQSGGWEEMAEPGDDDKKYVVVEDADSLSPGAFALEITGESNLPEYRPGDIVIVDPAVEPLPGDMVAARLSDSPSATLKRYRPRGRDNKGEPIIDLVPLNDDFPSLRIDADHPGEILGTVIEHRRYRRRRPTGFRSA